MHNGPKYPPDFTDAAIIHEKKSLINAPIMFYLTSFPATTMTTLFNEKREHARGNAATRVLIPSLWTTRRGKCPRTLWIKRVSIRWLGVSGLWETHSGDWDSWEPGRGTRGNKVEGVTCCRGRMCFCRGRGSSAGKTGWELKREVDAAGAQTQLYDRWCQSITVIWTTKLDRWDSSHSKSFRRYLRERAVLNFRLFKILQPPFYSLPWINTQIRKM